MKLPDARVVADLRTNAVILACASDADLAQLSAAVERLDVPAGGIETVGSE
jgi:phage-related baseplate assembly protein